MRRADDHCVRALEDVEPPLLELGVPAHGVLQLGAVRLDDERRTGGDADRPAEEHVVAEEEIRGQVLAHGGGVCLHPAVELVAAAVLHPLHVTPFVLVENEGRQQRARVGLRRLGAADVRELRVRVLAQHCHVVALQAPLPRELPRVDVRACAAEEVAVPDENLHDAAIKPRRGSRSPYVRWK